MPSSALVQIVDDDEVVQQSLALTLQSAGLGSEVYASAELFLPVLGRMKSGCVVTDIRLRDMTGLGLLGRIREASEAISVVVITGYEDTSVAVEAMKLGACDFLVKPLNGALLLASIRTALSRSRDLEKAEMEREDTLERINLLSRRERAVLEGLVAGKPNKLIAFDLSISPRTVEIYRANVMHKMQVASLSKLVRQTLLATGNKS